MEPNEERQGNDKKAERLAKRRERRRQRLLEETTQSFVTYLLYTWEQQLSVVVLDKH